MSKSKRDYEDRLYNRKLKANQKRSDRLNYGMDSSRLIKMETVSEIERFNMGRDAERMTQYNRAVEQWQNSVTTQLRATIARRSLSIAKDLEPKAYKDNYGIINRLGFSFPRHGIYIHKGAGRGQGGYTGSKWSYLKMINKTPVDTGIVRHTNPDSLGKQNEGKRSAFEWFDPVIRNRLSELADIVTRYFDTMIIDATKIFIEK